MAWSTPGAGAALQNHGIASSEGASGCCDECPSQENVSPPEDAGDQDSEGQANTKFIDAALAKCKAAPWSGSFSSGSPVDSGSGQGGQTGGGGGGTTPGGQGGGGGTTPGHNPPPEHPPTPTPHPPGTPLPGPGPKYGPPTLPPGPGPGPGDPEPSLLLGSKETHTVTAKSFIMGSSGGLGDINLVPGNAPASPGAATAHCAAFGAFWVALPSEDETFSEMSGDIHNWYTGPGLPPWDMLVRYQGHYRLFSEKKADIICVNERVEFAKEKEPRSDVGAEPVGTGVSKGFDKEHFLWNAGFVFQTWRFKGTPGGPAEALIQAAGSRTSTTIWHQVRALWICKEGKSVLCGAQLCGSWFPTHRMWHDGQMICTLPQGEVTRLWYPSSESASLVVAHPQCCQKKD
jgi:hypothetical protein